MPEIITKVFNAFVYIVPCGMMFFAVFFITVVVFIVKNWKKSIARLTANSGLPRGNQNPWPPQPHNH